MEEQANHTLVGAFVIVFLAALVIFIMWLAHLNVTTQSKAYDIYFQGSVTGLQVGGAVRYRGVPVGTVKEIKVDPDNVEQVRVTVYVEDDIPIKRDAYASLEILGLTGIAYIQINGGSKASPLLEDNGKRPIIPARASRLEELVSNVPDVLHQGTHLIQDLRAIFSPENRTTFEMTLKKLHAMIEELVKLLEDKPSSITHNLREVSLEAQKSFKSFHELAYTLKSSLEANDPSLIRFLTRGAETFETFGRIGLAIENNPIGFLTKNSQQGVQVP